MRFRAVFWPFIVGLPPFKKHCRRQGAKMDGQMVGRICADALKRGAWVAGLQRFACISPEDNPLELRKCRFSH